MDLQQLQLSENAQALASEAIASAKATAERDALKGNLAAYVRRCWQAARDARQTTGVELRMQQSLRQRKGEYDPEKLAAIRQTTGSEIYMMITSVKCRSATAWLRDVLSGTGTEKPWTLEPTPLPSLPMQAEQGLRARMAAEVGAAVASGLYPTREQVMERMEVARRQLQNLLEEKARHDAQATEKALDDVLTEGGWHKAMELLLDDLVTFPAAVMAGPLLRRKHVLEWAQTPEGWEARPTTVIKEEWERVSPFDFYPDPNATDIDDGYMIRRHRLSVSDIDAMRGSPGYDDEALSEVIAAHGRGGLREWLTLDQRTGEAETTQNEADWTAPIDAIEFWGAVPGVALREWGLADVADAASTYQANVWLIGGYVIKAVLNPDALGRKPFAKACYEEIPGSFWGNGVPDLIRDVQNVCNAAARAMVNNMGIASGPQVWVNVDRLPPGVKPTQLFPWKVWQTTSDEMGSTAPPMDFFQPDMHAAPLMAVFEKFSTLADEYSGIPRYMSGDNNVGGAARTASGLSMLMGNANKLMKHVVANIDRLVENSLQRLHLHLIHVRKDRTIRGDVRVVVRGALAVTVKDTMQMRRQELLTQTANPIDAQILGVEGRAELWRENLRGLGVNPDKVIPPTEVLLERAAQQAMAAQAAQAGAPGAPQLGAPTQAQPDPMMGANGGYPGDMGFNA